MSSRFLQQLRREQSLQGSSQTQRLYYRLRPGAAHLQMALVVAREQPNGHLEAQQPYPLQPAHLEHPPLFLDDADVTLLAQLAAWAPQWLHRSEGELPVATGASWLQALIATGRARGEQTRVTWGEALAVDCGWQLDGAGNQRLGWNGPAGTCVLPTQPPCFWDSLHCRAGPLATALHPDARPWLERPPRLAPDEVAGFIRRHGESFTARGLPLPRAIAAAELSPRPEPQLRFHTGPGDQRERLRLQFRYDCHGKPVVFDLGEPDAARAVFHGERDTLFTVQRDVQAEAALADTLTAALADCAALELADGELGFADRARWQRVMTEVVPALKSRGWHIVVERGFRHHFVRADQIRLAASWLDRDWFNLALTLEIDGESLPLLPLLAACARRYSPQWLQAQPAGAEVPVTLPDGRQVLIAAARIARWLAALVELEGETGAAEALRLPASQLHRLNALDDGALAPSTEAAELLDRARQIQQSPALEPLSLPAGFAAELRGYQRLGVAWLQQCRRLGVGGILADDMGLGKTVQTLAHLAIEREQGRLRRPALVVAPTSVLHNWQREAERFAPRLRCALLHGPRRHRLWPALADYDLLLTSYTLVVNDIDQWRQQELSTVILDEAQAIKNARTRTSRCLRELAAPYRLCLTGTPLQNHLGELWAQFEFLMPGFFDSEARFNRHYRRPVESEGDQARAQALLERVAPFILRRTKEEVARDLPPKTEMLLRLPLEGAQRELYEMLRQRTVAQLGQRLLGGDDPRDRVLILNALLQLRQACCDPRLLDLPQFHDAPSAKRERLRDMLQELVEEGRAILVFSQFTRMLDLIAADLAALGIDHLMLTGHSRDRGRLVERFQAGEAPVFLVSLKAGGTGLNLTRADTVIHYDPWWNSAAESQATDRSHRIGQDKPVFVYRLLAEDTVEEKVHALQQHKQSLLQQVYRAAEANAGELALDNAGLLALLEEN